MKTTYIKAKAIAKSGFWAQAWSEAQKDEGLSPEVTEEEWKDWLSGVLKGEAMGSKSSIFHADKLNMLRENLAPPEKDGALILIEHMLVVADNNKKFKIAFDRVLMDHNTEAFRDVASMFGDYWQDKSFVRSVDAIDKVFKSIH